MRVSPRVRRALVVLGVLLGVFVVVQAVLGPVRDLVERAVAGARWPEQREQLIDAMAAVTLDDRFVPTACPEWAPSGDGFDQRCFRVDAAPDEVVWDLRDGLADAGVVAVDVDCTDALDGTVLGCSAGGHVGGQLLLMGVYPDLNPVAAANDDFELPDMFLATSTVTLGAYVGLEPPSPS